MSTDKQLKFYKSLIGKPDYLHNAWKGDKVGRRQLHYWVDKHLGKPKKCIVCSLKQRRHNGRRRIQWANKDHKYQRNLKDWVALCYHCHDVYDVIFNNKYAERNNRTKNLKLNTVKAIINNIDLI